MLQFWERKKEKKKNVIQVWKIEWTVIEDNLIEYELQIIHINIIIQRKNQHIIGYTQPWLNQRTFSLLAFRTFYCRLIDDNWELCSVEST